MSIGLGKLVIKLVQTQDNVVRRIRVDRTTFTFADLEASASADTCTCLSYFDDEHETITLACEEDFVEAKSCSSGVLRVLIQDKNDLDIASGYTKLSAPKKNSVDTTPASVPTKKANKTSPPPPPPPVKEAAGTQSPTPITGTPTNACTNACNSRHGDCKFMRHVGKEIFFVRFFCFEIPFVGSS